jgi:hypothetical protein
MIQVDVKITNGFKMANADPSLLKMSFYHQDQSISQNFNLVSCFQASGRGSFNCYINGTEAVYDSQYILGRIAYNGVPFSAFVSINTIVGPYDHLVLVSGSNQTVTAD